MCVCLWMRPREMGVKSAWEEWLVLFARYLFNFFHDSRLHVLAEPRETLPSLPKQTKGASEYARACARASAHFCVAVHQSVCQSVIQRMLCAFRQMCKTWIWIFTWFFFSHSVELCQYTSCIYMTHTRIQYVLLTFRVLRYCSVRACECAFISWGDEWQACGMKTVFAGILKLRGLTTSVENVPFYLPPLVSYSLLFIYLCPSLPQNDVPTAKPAELRSRWGDILPAAEAFGLEAAQTEGCCYTTYCESTLDFIVYSHPHPRSDRIVQL